MIGGTKIGEINTLGTNFRSDVVAADMADAETGAETIELSRTDGITRETDKEVANVRHLEQDWETGGREVVRIATNRRGIYDNLPEGLFHSVSGLHEKSKEAIIHSFRRQSKEESSVRGLLRPYESEVDRAKLEIRLAEYRHDRPDKYRALMDTNAELWPVLRKMDSVTATMFLQMAPYIADVRENPDGIAWALSMITGYGVVIMEKTREEIPQGKYPRLDESVLGVNAILMGPVAIPYLEVAFTPPRKDLTEVLPGKQKREVLESLLKIFMPKQKVYDIVIQPREEDYTGRFDDPNLPCILGVNAILENDNDEL